MEMATCSVSVRAVCVRENVCVCVCVCVCAHVCDRPQCVCLCVYYQILDVKYQILAQICGTTKTNDGRTGHRRQEDGDGDRARETERQR